MGEKICMCNGFGERPEEKSTQFFGYVRCQFCGKGEKESKYLPKNINAKKYHGNSRVSSEAEQLSRKQQVASSNLAPGSIGVL